MAARIGVIVNPIAGMGGRVGLKGTDGPAVLAEARARGAVPEAGMRAERALRRLEAEHQRFAVLAAEGSLGADAARAAGLTVTELTRTSHGETTSADTRDAAGAMQAAGVDLVLFAGGDGTARDILAATGGGVPILGIPTGVKMHSAVFATSPEAAGNLAALVVAGDARVREREAEVMDLDEDAVRAGRVSARLFGYARVPYERSLLQNCKAGATLGDEAELDALAGRIVADMEPGRVYVFGCGTTTRRIKRRLGFEGTLLGVDVVIDRRLLAADVTEERLLRLVKGARTTIVTSVTGGQGFVFGRGNQQISARVIRAVGRENVMIVTGRAKLLALEPPCLRVDTGEPKLDRELAGYLAVHTAPGQTMMMKVAA